jgi:hypothetical protein
MAEPFDSLIKAIQDSMTTLKNDSATLLSLLQENKLIDDANKQVSISKELKDIILALTSQDNYTEGTLKFLGNPPPIKYILKDLKTVTNLIQIYFEITQPLEKSLSDLVTLLPSQLQGKIAANIQANIQAINIDRINLLEAQTKALQEFGSDLQELGLKELLKTSNSIRIKLKNLSINPADPKLPAQTSPVDFSTEIDRLIIHLNQANEFFKTFNENDSNVTASEPNEIQILISNWGDLVSLIDKIEQTDSIRQELSDPAKSRSAIAQSIKIHDLLESNYDYLTALVRSIDLVSAGSL